MVLFKDITKENFWDCIELAVTKEQVDFDGQVFGSEHIMRLDY